MAAQVPDIILIRGEKMGLYSNPLENYWLTQGKRKPQFTNNDECKRGYVATWEIVNRELWLCAVDATIMKKFLLFISKQQQCRVRDLFPSATSIMSRIKATWYTGKLRIPSGRMTEYVHSGYDSHFEQEMIITVKHGNVIKEVLLDYTQQKLLVTTITEEE